jgi:uncharacterized membrane protein
MCVYGYKRKSVNTSGAVFGIIVAIILTVASPVYMVSLAAFFFSSSKATKYRQDVKMKIEKDFKVGGQRNWVQVLCNAGPAALIALCHLIECGVGERSIDFENDYVVSFFGEIKIVIHCMHILISHFSLRCGCYVCFCMLQRGYLGE